MKKQKLTKEDALKLLTDNLNKLFRTNGISGILEVPGAGTLGIFKDDGAKLKILNHAKIEERKLELEREQEAIKWIRRENNNGQTQDKPSYIH